MSFVYREKNDVCLGKHVANELSKRMNYRYAAVMTLHPLMLVLARIESGTRCQLTATDMRIL